MSLTTPLSFDATSSRNPSEYPHIPYISRNYGSIFIQLFYWLGSVKRIFSARVRIGRSGSSKVIDFGTNRKRVYFGVVTLVLSCTVSEILQVFCTPPLFHHNFGTFSLDQIAHVGVNPSRYQATETARLCNDCIIRAL